MSKRSESWHSQRLGRDVSVRRWGEVGTPVVFFPTAAGDSEECERFLLIDALSDLLEEGRIKLYSLDSIPGMVWLKESSDARSGASIQLRYDAFLRDEFVPFVRDDCGAARDDASVELVASGSSIGAYEALIATCRHPDVFRTAICMSGTYDLSKFLEGPRSDEWNSISPLEFLPRLDEDDPRLRRLRERYVLLTHATGRWEEPAQSWRVAEALGSRGVPNRVDEWGTEWDHDWPVWRKMLPQYLRELLGAEAEKDLTQVSVAPGRRMLSGMIHSALLLLTLVVLAGTGPAGTGPAPELVHVFVLAGQSNMEGKVQNPLLEHQASDPGTRELFAHLRDGDGWIERDDVFIRFGGRRGPLTIGYGSPNRTGVELELGHVLGEAFDEPVLLIKTAWGGHSLHKNFRPPGAGLPENAVLEADLEGARERVEKRNAERGTDDPLPTRADIEAEYGASYRKMMAEVQETLAHMDEWFPTLAGHEPRLAGFVWHQGWNDQYGGAELEYRANLEQLVRDVRGDLEAPERPFVIGVMGQNMSKPAQGAMQVIQEAQLAVPEVEDLRGTVIAVRTDVLVDTAAEELYPTWRDNFEEWQKTGSDHAYHYLGSAIWHVRMGRAFGEALLGLMGE